MELIDKEEVLKNDENFAVGLVVQKRERKGDFCSCGCPIFLCCQYMGMCSRSDGRDNSGLETIPCQL